MIKLTKDFLHFSQFMSLWEEFSPESPLSRDQKAVLPLFKDPKTLERLWDETESLLDFFASIEKDCLRQDRILHHLKRIPRIPTEKRECYDEIELFQFKKFLFNYRSLMEQLDEARRSIFGFRFESKDVEDALNIGRQSTESFYISDEYDSELQGARREIRDIDQSLESLQNVRIQEIQTRFKITFQGQEFLLVPKADLDTQAARDWLKLEPYDETHMAVRLLPDADMLRLQDRRQHLLSQERLLENRVLERLSWLVNEHFQNIADYSRALCAFDLAHARARLATKNQMTRPRIAGSNEALIVEEGRFLPCQSFCQKHKAAYTPLNVTFDQNIQVIFGSNMGGKTIALKTLAFLQLCVQTGLFVPAQTFATQIFSNFHFFGEIEHEGELSSTSLGLSGFGFEIYRFNQAFADFTQPTLALFDEFARTTNSVEAECLISAITEYLSRQKACFALFSTHFRNIQRQAGVGYWRMRGLNTQKMRSTHHSDLESCIRAINEAMDYHLVRDTESPIRDALSVARHLGLDVAIADHAQTLLTQN